MSAIPFPEACERIKSGLDIVDVIRRHVILKKSGRNYVGKCPFHNDKSPSMNVSREKGIFKCFSCGVGGDALTFLMRIENRTFGEVIRELAREQGVDILREGRSEEAAVAHTAQKDVRQKILELNEAASLWYQERLAAQEQYGPETGRAGDVESTVASVRYFAERYPDPVSRREVAARFRLGLAPPGWENLTPFLKERFDFVQANPDLLVEAGLVGSREYGQGHYDRFRNRLVIPIQDEQGRVVAFGARALSEEDKPKYLNSPETAVYKKNQILYGLAQARESIRQNRATVVMEGYFDVISAHMAGVTEAVGSCGTAMTENHLKLLTRFGAERIFLAFDSDEAGIKAALGAIQLMQPYLSRSGMESELSIQVLMVPDGKDPDVFIRQHGGDAFRELMAQARPHLAFQCDMALRDILIHTPEGRLQAAARLTPILAGIARPTVLEEYLHRYAERLGISQEALALEVRRYEQARDPVAQSRWRNPKNSVGKKAISNSAPTSLKRHSPLTPDLFAGPPTVGFQVGLKAGLSPRQEAIEKNLLRLMLYNRDSFSMIMRFLDASTRLLFSDSLHQEILDALLAIADESDRVESEPTETADCSLTGTLIEKMNHLYFDKANVLHRLAELAMTAETFGESLGLGELTGSPFQEKVIALATQHLEQLTRYQSWEQLKALRMQAHQNGDDEVPLTYAFSERMPEIDLPLLKALKLKTSSS